MPCTSAPCWPKNHHTCHGWKIALGADATAARARRETARGGECERREDRRRDEHRGAQARRTCAWRAARAAPGRPRAAPTPCWRSRGRARGRRAAAAATLAGARREQHRGDAQAGAEQLLGVADFERAQRERVGDADPERDGARERRAALRAHPRDERARRAARRRAGRGAATMRYTASAPPPHSPGSSANGARSTSEPP